MSYLALAFYTGLFASLHCVAMCGPLILSLPFSKEPLWFSILQRVLYQAGRILMYGILGLIIGLLGKGFSLLGLQQILSVVTGLLLVAGGLSYFIKTKARSSSAGTKFIQMLTKLLGKQLSKPYGSFVAGSLNGLLPCGIVYIALAQALNQSTLLQSGKFMLFFGLGTTPLLLVTVAMPMLFRKIKAPALLIPLLFMISGSFLISRGLNLDIPYISHSIDVSGSSYCK